MFRRTVLATLLLSMPAPAQPVAVPDCTVDVALQAGPKLDVVYRCRSATPLSFMAEDDKVAAHVQGRRVETANGVVEARYRYDLEAYARAIDSPATAVLRGGGVFTGLSGWLLEPRGYEHAPTIDIRVNAANGLAFASGLPRVGDAWRLAGTRVMFAGYTALGRFSLHEIAVPAPGSLRPGAPRQDGMLRLVLLDGFSEAARSDLVDWARRTAEAEANYWQGFTARQAMVGMVPVNGGRAVGYGRTVSGGGATVMVEIGRDVDRRRLFNDWVLVHELIHTGMPYIRGRGTWFMEGAATYVEPIIRARAGWKTEAEVWKEWVDNMPRGAQAFAGGLSNASGQQNYWGGAIFMLLADVGLRRATQGARGLEDCLGGVLWNGLDASQRVTLPDYVAACDRATGTTVMSGLLERYFTKGEAIDLAALWKELGIGLSGGRIVLDDAAPFAQWRKMIVMGPPGRPPRPVKLPWDS